MTGFTYWVSIVASQPYGTLYIGVTNDLFGRIKAHREGTGSRFTSARTRIGPISIPRCWHCRAIASLIRAEPWVLGTSPRMTTDRHVSTSLARKIP